MARTTRATAKPSAPGPAVPATCRDRALLPLLGCVADAALPEVVSPGDLSLRLSDDQQDQAEAHCDSDGGDRHHHAPVRIGELAGPDRPVHGAAAALRVADADVPSAARTAPTSV